jgi:UDP-glucose 4-epimerase
MDEFEVPFFIFSSSCSVYGNAADLPVTENTRFERPESPYAGTKQAGENLIREYAFIRPKKKIVMLRYFNPAGAHESGYLGEAPSNPSTNLVPVVTETAIGKRKEVVVFGNDYDTRDGSCLRDYIHIMDLADAHTRSLKHIVEGKNETNCESFNLGIGEGVTVLEAIHAFESVTGQSLNYRIGPRRFGDVAAIYANYDKAAQQLGWKPKRNIEDIMRSAWEWEQKQAVSSGVR